ncbi:MAG: PEGA domain-containing protein, partial [Methanoculleus sp.]
MRLRESLLFLGVLVALLCIPAAIAAMGGGGLGEPYYIKVVLDEPKEHLKLNIETIDILDPLDIENTSITLQSTEEGDLKIIECPSLGPITREFSPASGHYHGAHVTVVENKTIDGETIPRYQHIYVTKTIPSFTMKIPGREGNALLIKCPEDTGASFIEIFNDADMEVYLFTKNAILYIKGMEATAYGGIKSTDYDTSDLGYTLGQNKVDLDNFSAGASRAREMMGTFPETRPETGTYILAAVEYDGSRNTMHILAAMPVIILDGDTPVTWSGDAPHSWDKGATIFFDGNIDVDKIAYALVKEDTTYSLQVKISTAELANQPLPASGTDVISVLRSIAREGALEEYTLTCDANTSKVIYDSGLAIVEGYGCSGAKSGSSIEIASETLATLSTGTYYLYALGMKGQSVTAVNQTEVTIVAPPPQYGNLTINSVPEGASIWLDGEETGKVTNTTLTEVEVGKHNVT